MRAGESGCRKVGEGLAGFRMSVCRGHDEQYVLAQLSSHFMAVQREFVNESLYPFACSKVLVVTMG